MSEAISHSAGAKDSPVTLIIGAGLIGTSIGLALSAQGKQVFLLDRTPSHALVAASLGAGSADPPVNVDMVVVAVPPAVTSDVVVDALDRYPSATVTDVASVKSPVLESVQMAGADLSRYIGSHPMAGSHRSGPLTARADMFYDRIWVIAVHGQADPDRIEAVRTIATACQARVEIMDPLEHDRAVAEISHVPQIISSLVAGNLASLQGSHLRLAGQGVRDVTRIAASDEEMWTQITVANQDAIRAGLEKLSQGLDQLKNHVDSPRFVARFFRQGVEGTRLLPGKHGRTQKDYEYVVVEIPDSPGALATLFRDIDAVGVNVEDVRIEHDHQREIGYLSIMVEPDKAEDLAAAISQAGWTLRP